jgi:E3 ubiquitin-protein ligase TRIP12
LQDEEVEVLPVDFEEAVTMDEDELSEDEDEDEDEEHDEMFGEDPVPLCKADRVHDVQLGDGADSGALASTSEVLLQPVGGVGVVSRSAILTSAAEMSGIRTLGSRGSLSFAAAAMAGAGINGARNSSRNRRSFAAISAANVPPKLVFSLGGKPLNRMWTIFQAVQRQAHADEDEEERYTGPGFPLGSGRRLWDEVYTITYQRADSSDSTPSGVAKAANAGPSSKAVSGPEMDSSWQQASLLDSVLQGELPCDFDKTNSTYNILLLLRVLEALNRLAPRLRIQAAVDAFAKGKADSFDEIQVAGSLVPKEEFLSSKLTPKLARQMQDALALCSGGLPAWCHQLTQACPFLFPFETRRQYFHSTAFGLSRALQRLQQQQSVDGRAAHNERELRVGRLQRQKVRVSRSRILDSAAKVMELYSGHKAVLEVEYFGEVGTGLGPTLEFYTLLSHELQKSTLDLWRTESSSVMEVDAPSRDVDMVEEHTEESLSAVESHHSDPFLNTTEYVNAPHGLFPRPWPPDTDSSNTKYGRVLGHFRLLGQVIAKALQDGRLLDLPLSTAFYKLALGQDLDLYDVQTIDPELGRTLLEMQGLVRRKQFLEKESRDAHEAINGLRFQGSSFEDLCLDFTLPGYPEFTLKPGGKDIMVGLGTLEEYVALVVDATVKSGIAAQVDAVRAGFNQV